MAITRRMAPIAKRSGEPFRSYGPLKIISELFSRIFFSFFLNFSSFFSHILLIFYQFLTIFLSCTSLSGMINFLKYPINWLNILGVIGKNRFRFSDINTYVCRPLYLICLLTRISEIAKFFVIFLLIFSFRL